MIIEKLNFKDIDQLIELYKDLTPFKNDFEKSQEIYEEMIKDENYLLLIAKEGDKVIGSVLGICCKSLASGGEPFLVIEDVIVDKSIRGKGVGSRLFESIENFAKKKKCTYAILVSSDFRTKGHKFYEKMGFIDGVRGFRKVYTEI